MATFYVRKDGKAFASLEYPTITDKVVDRLLELGHNVKLYPTAPGLAFQTRAPAGDT